ncbi:MAG TPA: alpha/beta hydrolase [Solirubrobacteraceae bacterium]|nr:alpha/beta hydrolase [Solirubrobacteraceae bacterium]
MSDRVDVAVDGGELATYRLGALTDTGAPLVLAIHGITSTSRTWLAAARALGDRATLLAVDLRGRGRSAGLAPVVGLDAHVRDMVAVLDAVGLERAVVVGHSLGAYIAARLAISHPQRIQRLVLVDGGLTIPASVGAEPAQFVQDFLGPTFERLEMTFPDVAAYQAWWAQHPAVANADVDPADLDAYAAYDLVGEPPEMRSGITPQVVRDDGLDLFGEPDGERLSVPSVFLCAPRGMVDDPHPMQPLADVQAWAAADPGRRQALQVSDTNHYAIAWGAHGAAAVADAIAAAAGAA